MRGSSPDGHGTVFPGETGSQGFYREIPAGRRIPLRHRLSWLRHQPWKLQFTTKPPGISTQCAAPCCQTCPPSTLKAQCYPEIHMVNTLPYVASGSRRLQQGKSGPNAAPASLESPAGAKDLGRQWELLERVKGIEPSSSAWKAVALPLSYTRRARTAARGVTLACAASQAHSHSSGMKPERLVEGVGFEPT